MINFKEMAKKEIETNKEFGYVASKGEIAASVWHNHMTVDQRASVLPEIPKKKTDLQNARACYDYVEARI